MNRRNQILLGILSADDVNGNPFRLREFLNVLGRDHAGIIGAVGKDDHHFPSGEQGGVFQSYQQGIVESNIISGNRIAHCTQDLPAIRADRSEPLHIAAKGVKRYPVGRVKRAHKIRDRVLGVSETPIHEVAGVKQDEDVGSGRRRCRASRRILRDGVHFCSFRLTGGRFGEVGAPRRYAAFELRQFPRNLVSLSKAGQSLDNAVFANLKVGWLQPCDITAFAIRHCDIQ